MTRYLDQLILMACPVAALLLLVLSYFFEQQAYSALLPNLHLTLGAQVLALSVLLAIAFNAGKFLIFWIIGATPHGHRSLAGGLQLFLFSNSLLCSLLVFSAYLHEPRLNEAVVTAQSETKGRYARQELSVRQGFEAQAKELRERFARHRQALHAQYDPDIRAAQDGMDKEREIGGQGYRGARYLGYEADKTRYETLLRDALNELNTGEDTELAALKTRQHEAFQALDTNRTQALEALTLDRFRGRIESQHPMLVAFAGTWKGLFRVEIDPSLATLVMSLLASIIIEFSPFVLMAFTAQRVSALASESPLGHRPDLRVIHGASPGPDEQRRQASTTLN